MQLRQFWSAVGITTVMAALAACAGTSTAPNASATLGTQMSTDAAASAGQAAVSDVDMTGNNNTSGSYSILKGRGISAAVIGAQSANGCQQTGLPADLRWYCPTDTLTIMNNIVADTLIITPNFEFFALGVAQSAFDASTTDSINFGGASGVPVYTAAHHPRWHGVSYRVRNHSVTDLTPSFSDTVRTWNGNTTVADTSAFTGTIWSVSYTGQAYDTTANVVFIHPQETHPFPVSGQFHRWVTWNYDATGPSSKTGTVSRHIVVTYNGTQTAQLQVIGTTTLTCDLDLITGEVSNCH
jgi:hypothetical protein